MLVPFRERLSCTVNEACSATGIGRTKLYEALADGRLKSTKVDGRRLVLITSLIELLENHALPDTVDAGGPVG